MNKNAFRVPETQPGSRMPQYQQQQPPATPGADVSARLTDSAAGIIRQGADDEARQLDTLGQGLRAAAKAGYDLYTDYQTSKAKDAWLQYKQSAEGLKAELATLAGKDAVDPEKGVSVQIARFKENRTRISKELGGMAAERFEQAAADVDSNLSNWGIGKAHGEAVNYGNATSKARISLAQNEALSVASDAKAFGEKMGIVEVELKSMAARSGFDETWVQAEMQDAQQKTLVQAIGDSIAGEQLGRANFMLKAYAPMLGGAAEGLRARAAAKGRELDVRARAQARERQMDIRLAASGFNDQIAYGMHKGDFSAAENTVGKLTAMNAPKEAAELSGRLQLYKAAQVGMQADAGLPLLEQAERSAKTIESFISPNNAKQTVAVLDMVKAAQQKNIHDFMQDSAGFLVKNAPQLQQEGIDFMERTRILKELQNHFGEGLSFTPNVLPKAQALAVKNSFDAAPEPQKKLEQIRELQKKTGPYFRQVAQEAKLPPAVVHLADALPVLEDNTAGMLVSAATVAWHDIPKSEDPIAENDAAAAVNDTQLMKVFNGLHAAFPAHDGFRAQALHLGETLTKTKLLGGDVTAVGNAYQTIADSNMFLIIPTKHSVNTDDLEDLLLLERENFETARMNAEVRGMSGMTKLQAQENIRRRAQNGIWASDAHGAVLLDPDTGIPLHYPDGRDVRINYSEVNDLSEKAKNKKADVPQRLLDGRHASWGRF